MPREPDRVPALNVYGVQQSDTMMEYWAAGSCVLDPTATALPRAPTLPGPYLRAALACALRAHTRAPPRTALPADAVVSSRFESSESTEIQVPPTPSLG